MLKEKNEIQEKTQEKEEARQLLEYKKGI